MGDLEVHKAKLAEFGPPDLVENVPVHGRGVGNRQTLKSFQPELFYDSLEY